MQLGWICITYHSDHTVHSHYAGTSPTCKICNHPRTPAHSYFYKDVTIMLSDCTIITKIFDILELYESYLKNILVYKNLDIDITGYSLKLHSLQPDYEKALNLAKNKWLCIHNYGTQIHKCTDPIDDVNQCNYYRWNYERSPIITIKLSECDALIKTINWTKCRIDKLKELICYPKTIRLLQMENSNLQTDITNIKSQLESKNDKIDQLEKSILDTKITCESTTTENQLLLMQISQLQCENNNLKIDMDQLIIEKSIVDADNKTLTEKVADLETQVASDRNSFINGVF